MNSGVPRFPHLDPDLLQLRGDALEIWGDASVREQALLDVLNAFEQGQADQINREVARVDSAVAAGLEALGLPRGPIAGVVIEPVGRSWLARKAPGCLLHFDSDALSIALRVARVADDVFRTWVHESIHGRQPFVVTNAALHNQTRGYEEGLAEGLARLATGRKAGMTILESSYDYYVRTYMALSAATGVDLEELWRSLWTYPCGQVRDAFLPILDELRHRMTGNPLTDPQKRRFLSIGDQLFAADRARERHAALDVLRRLWEAAFR